MEKEHLAKYFYFFKQKYCLTLYINRALFTPKYEKSSLNKLADAAASNNNQ